MKKSPIKILISVQNLDYAEVLCQALKSLVHDPVILEICRTSSDQKCIYDHNFMLLDLSLIINDPFVSIKSIHNRFPDLKIILLSLWDQPSLSEKLINSGAFAIYLVGDDVHNLIKVLAIE